MRSQRRARTLPWRAAMIGGVVLAGVVAVVLPALGVALAIGGVVAVLLPGAALGWSARAGRQHPVDVVPAAAFAVATVPLGGLLLSVLPFGLATASWLLLGGALLGLAGLLPKGRAYRLRSPALPAPPPARTVALLAAGVALAVAAFVVAGSRPSIASERFTQLWLVPGGDLAAAPSHGAADPATVAELGITNHEGSTSRYRVDLILDGEVIQSWSRIDLADGETWRAPVTEPVPDNGLLEARVFVGSGAQPYRTARLWGPIGVAGG